MLVAFLYPIAMQPWSVPALLVTAALATSVGAQRDALQRAVDNAEARGVRTGVAVCSSTGDVLFRHRAAESFAPASNMKLLTAAGVLQGLGADHQFETVFSLEAGELVVQAGGDPNWIAETEHDPEQVFALVARALAEHDVHSVRGVRLEPGVFHGPSRPKTWPQDQLYTYYCAPTGGFVLQQGTFVMAIERSGGRNARATLLAPPAGYEIRGGIREVASQKGATYGAIDQGGTIRVRGKFYEKSPRVEIRTAVNDPERWFADALAHQLRKNGVRVGAGGPAHQHGEVYRHRTPLEPALRRMLEDSSNFDAEQCLRVLGARTRRDGSLLGGNAALRDRLADLVGRVPEGVVIADGSGLSKENRITPGLLVVAMFQLQRKGLWSQLQACLPVAGRTGTLRKRFVGSDLVDKVRAKTGWIRGASSLSGMVELPDGELRWFSILMNYDRGRNGLNKELKQIQEDIVAAVAAMQVQR
jgi:D-alanyl-D-alanine carboxypeptidase/D-alanyl-D-alanine-endopeptidase (penicillin-binding protein 4)